ncbi:hypothetical protein E2C01_057087 [Portunus trituberculatus]|uniref:Uncharacterized protein n=1 Tax=Portunus trituberculatus TaxID=210409 RepID=A0A5B7H044_PORTR|nr:hypothetical protein [Portunus trituberculatus]
MVKFIFGSMVAMEHRVYTWRFESKLGDFTANHAAPSLGTNSGNLPPTCNMASTSAKGGTGEGKDNGDGGKDESG